MPRLGVLLLLRLRLRLLLLTAVLHLPLRRGIIAPSTIPTTSSSRLFSLPPLLSRSVPHLRLLVPHLGLLAPNRSPDIILPVALNDMDNLIRVDGLTGEAGVLLVPVRFLSVVPEVAVIIWSWGGGAVVASFGVGEAWRGDDFLLGRVVVGGWRWVGEIALACLARGRVSDWAV